MTGKIRNYKDLARFLGASSATEEAVSRRVYKDTDCGAWAKFGKSSEWHGIVYRTVKTKFTKSILGYCLVGIGLTSSHRWRSPAFCPPYLQWFIDDMKLRRNGHCWVVTDPSNIAFLDGKYNGVSPFILKTEGVGFRADELRRFASKPYVEFGSIVEGSDETSSIHRVYLPCTPDDVLRAIEAVEEECKDIWGRTHGCEKCWPDEEWQPGNTEVNVNCEHCKGKGAII